MENEWETQLINFALIGAGLMGRNHARVISEFEGVRLAMVVDSDAGRAKSLADEYETKWATDISGLCDTDAIILASVTDSHYTIATELMRGRLPILIEKPIASSLSQVQDIVSLAAKTDVPIMCGFVERFNPVFSTAKDLISSELLQISSMRQSPRNPRATSSVVWDLLIHDIDLTIQLARFNAQLVKIHGSGVWCPTSSSIEAVEATIHPDQGPLIAHSASRLWHRKIRTMKIVDEDCLLELDFLRQTITKFRHVSQEQVIDDTMVYRSDTIIDIPFVRHAGEPLALQLAHFVDLMRGELDFRAELDGILLSHKIAESVECKCRLISAQ